MSISFKDEFNKIRNLSVEKKSILGKIHTFGIIFMAGSFILIKKKVMPNIPKNVAFLKNYPNVVSFSCVLPVTIALTTSIEHIYDI